MKKIGYLCFLILCLNFTGCGDKEKLKETAFEHYDLSDKQPNIYTYYNDNGAQVYALADITPISHESILTGLFYQVGNNDYILIETLESSTTNAYKLDSMYRFWGNKLYGTGNGQTPSFFEIELDRKDSKMKEIKLNFLTTGIKNIDNKSITLSGITFIDEHNVSKTFKCTLKDFECIMQ